MWSFSNAQSNANPTLHKLAEILGNEDNGIGALARLYKQVDSINDQHDDEELTLFDDTRTVGN